MIKLNRTTEYGLMALRHMSRKSSSAPREVTSAREIADSYGLPFEITAKTLQRLKDTGLIQSAHGSRGGYTLQRNLSEVSLAEFLELMEGPQAVVACAGSGSSTHSKTSGATSISNPGTSADTSAISAGIGSGAVAHSKSQECEYDSRCEIKQLMNHLNSKIFGFLSGIPLAEIAEGMISPAVHPTTYSAGLAGSIATGAAPLKKKEL